MSRRESTISGSLQQWRGVDQRTSPTLVQDGFFVWAVGTYFGLSDNAERVTGKSLAGLLSGPVLNIFQFGNNVIVQGYGKVWFTDVQGLLDLLIRFKPDAPAAPTISNIQLFSMDLTAVAAYPFQTLSFSLQQSTDNVVWTTIATGLAPLQTVTAGSLTSATLYYFRLLSVGAGTNNFTAGAAASATTNTPSAGNTRITELGLGDTRITESGDTRLTE